jgi:DNA-binding transcriptional LysR family regulator
MTSRREAISPNEMLVFAAVARAGGIRRASTELGMPRSSVSRQLANLERTLAGRLVTRTSRRFTLTPLGDALVQHCEQLEDLMRSSQKIAVREAREPSGTLRIAASPVVGEEFLPELIAQYLERFPNVRVNVQLSSEFVDLRRTVDVAVRTGPIQDASDLYAARLGTSLKGHYASPAYLKKHGVPAAPADLAGHACVLISGAVTWGFLTRGGEQQIAVSGSLHVDSPRLARSAAVAGAGIVRLPSTYARELVTSKALVPILEKHWPRTTLYAVHTAGHPAPPKIRAFIEMLRAVMSKKLE